MQHVTEPAMLAWPAPVALPKGFAQAVDDRLDLIYAKAKKELLTSRLFKALIDVGLAAPWAWFIRPRLRDAVVEALTKGIKDQKLWD